MSRYLVTGCAGFIGSHLAESLAARGDAVIGVDCFTPYYDRSLKESNLALPLRFPEFSFAEADLAFDSVAALVAGADGVFHLAGEPGVRASWGPSFDAYVRNNILATQRLLEEAAAARVKVVFASSSSVYGDAERFPTPENIHPMPLSPYGVTKLACESLIEAYQRSRAVEVVSLRYFTVYGPRQRPDMAFGRIVRAVATNGVFKLFGDGAQTRDFTYVGDAVAATILAMDADVGNTVFNVGGGHEESLATVIAMVEGLCGRSLVIEEGQSAVGDVRRTSADTSRIRAALGWKPTTDLETGLAAHLEWELERSRTTTAPGSSRFSARR
jgi:UDP-glucuronate 4-epimerase